MQQKLLFPIVLIALTLFAWLGNTFGTKWVVMSIIGFGLGFTLSFSRFGIVFGWREMLTQKNSYYVRIHLLTIAIEILLFTICLSFSHSLFGDKMTGNIMAISIPFVAGAFLFGIGMQLAGCCASGILYCCGEGRPRFWIVLLFYGIGTLIGNSFKPELSSIFPGHIVTVKDLTGNLWTGMLINLLFVGLLYIFFCYIERNKTGQLTSIFTSGSLFWKDSHFTVLSGGIIIAILNSSIVAIHGSAWTITGAIYESALHIASFFGLFEGNPKLAKPLFINPMVGMFAAGLLGAAFSACLLRERNRTPLTIQNILAGIIGGLLMGCGGAYAACNLGGFFDGTASGSVHGWLWMLMALCGSIIGIRLRKLFNI